MPYLITQNPDDKTWSWTLVIENNHAIATSPHPFLTEEACCEGIKQVRREAPTARMQYEGETPT